MQVNLNTQKRRREAFGGVPGRKINTAEGVVARHASIPRHVPFLLRLLPLLTLALCPCALPAANDPAAAWRAADDARVAAMVSAVIGYIIWVGLAEAILLAIALERNTRQTRDRLPRHQPDEAPALRV